VGVILAFPIAIVLVFLFVFYPQAAALVLAAFGVVISVFFCLKGRVLANRRSGRHGVVLDDDQRRLLDRYPLFFGFYYGQRFFRPLLLVLQYLSFPLAIGLAVERLWIFIPLAGVAFASLALARVGFDPRRKILSRFRRASDSLDRKRLVEEVRILEDTFSSFNGFRPHPIETESDRDLGQSPLHRDFNEVDSSPSL